MHKLTPSLLLALAGLAGAAQAQPRIDLPGPALQAAFESATRGTLDEATLRAHAGHPLAGWLEFASLRTRLDALPASRGQAFLSKYPGQPVATAFRREWLPALARRKDWNAVMQAWSDEDADVPAQRCIQLAARQALGRSDAQWVTDAQATWRGNGKSLPNECDAPFAQLATQGMLTPALRWERIDKAASEGEAGVVRAIATGLPTEDATLARKYAAFIDKPDASAAQWPKTPRSRLVASHGLAKLAKKSPDAIDALFPAIAQALGFDAAERGRVLDEPALNQWRVRDAIARGDWNAVKAAWQRMPEAQRDDSRWTYLAARASEKLGDAAGAKALFAQAAKRPDFHGFLAADKLDASYALCPWTPAVAPAAKAAIAGDANIIRAVQLAALDRKAWATREWNAALARYTDEQRRIAVEVAQDNGWLDRGVFGLVNVGGKRFPDELRLYQLRFPLRHETTIRREAGKHRLDPAWVTAEIRAESLFDPTARSSADARGLMQVLPGTGAGVAAKLGLPWGGGQSLYEPETNIALGTAYLRQLLDKYGKPYLVMAGYNAGPAPVNRWLGERPDLDADLWIETIGYKETREYVARVLAFSTMYDWRLNGDALRLTDRMNGRMDGPRKQFACPP